MNGASDPSPYLPHPYAQWDAAYVLGALSPAERREYEEHLSTCPACQTAIAELAGMPGLLGQVAVDSASPPADEPATGDEPPPATLMPAMITDLRRRRRVVRTLIGVAAALVVLMGVTGLLVIRGLLPAGSPSDSFRIAFSPVAPSAMTAVADVVPLDEGTEFRVECVYGESNEPKPGGARAEYGIFVVDRSGRPTLAKTWNARPNRKMTPEAKTTLRVNQIARVEIKDLTDGQIVLRADLR